MIPSACQKCGCTTATTKAQAGGAVRVMYDLAYRTVDYSAMHADLTYRGGAIIYCQNCGKRLGRVEDAGDFEEDA